MIMVCVPEHPPPRDNTCYLDKHSVPPETQQQLLCSALQRLRTALGQNRLTSYKLDTMYQAQRDHYPSHFTDLCFIWTEAVVFLPVVPKEGTQRKTKRLINKGDKEPPEPEPKPIIRDL